jgi:hypothetical protein
MNGRATFRDQLWRAMLFYRAPVDAFSKEIQ